ncbi:MAG TPA: AraC family transcriptional regulator [Rhodanobacteraceae bacterium]|nr:AraC family transcriptional regulator [Rhodanobacteraceae bacterium]
MDGGNGSIAIAARPGARSIRIDFEQLAVNGRIARSADDEPMSSGQTLRILLGSGRACAMQSSEHPTVLIPLRGRLRTTDGDGSRVLNRGQVLIAESGQRLQAIGGRSALWLAFVAPNAVWRQLFDAARDMPLSEPLLFPAVHLASRLVRRSAVRVAREARRAEHATDDSVVLLQFASLLAELQASFVPMIRRCPGRTLAQRRSVFLRLQRVYNWMESSSNLDLGVAGFARVANYSPCHFVRTFNAVYGETPHAVLMEHRLRHAFRLVYDTELSITEVARASGFEDRCAFARSFKQRFGRTATAVRRRATAAVA